MQVDSLLTQPPGKPIGVVSLSLLQGNFPAQKSNRGLLHCILAYYRQVKSACGKNKSVNEEQMNSEFYCFSIKDGNYFDNKMEMLHSLSAKYTVFTLEL